MGCGCTNNQITTLNLDGKSEGIHGIYGKLANIDDKLNQVKL